jgi:hypothetical protein
MNGEDVKLSNLEVTFLYPFYLNTSKVRDWWDNYVKDGDQKDPRTKQVTNWKNSQDKNGSVYIRHRCWREDNISGSLISFCSEK